MLPFAPAVSVRTVIEAVVVCALTGALFVQGLRLNAARDEARTLVAQVSQLQAAINAQNAGIEVMRADTARRDQAATAAAKTAQKALTRAQARIAAIEGAQVPESCDAAVQWLVDAVKEPQ